MKTILSGIILLFLFLSACSQTTDPLDFAGCTGDGNCPPGQECSGGGCIDSPPSLYPHIQLCSVLFRDPLDDVEVDWRATHNDLLIGIVPRTVDMTRMLNPAIKIASYINMRHLIHTEEAEVWAAQNGYDVENFFLHYRQDMMIGGYESVVLVEGFPAGMVPGWNPDPQPGDQPASAIDRSQARVPGRASAYHETWYYSNISDPGCRLFVQDLSASMVDGSLYEHSYALGPLDGLLTDVALYYPMFNEGYVDRTCEFYSYPLDDAHPYAHAFATFQPELSNALAARFNNRPDVIPNYGHVYWLRQPDPFSQSVRTAMDWFWGEVWIVYRGGSSPLRGPTKVVTYESDYEASIADIVRMTRAGDRVILGAQNLAPDESRGRIFTLALYYLAHNRNTYFAYEAERSHMYDGRVRDWQWNPAVEYDIGFPAPVPAGQVDFDGRSGSSEHYVFAAGPDPFDSTLTFNVLARNFTNGMVLAKMLPWGSVDDSLSTTTHLLDGSYYLLGGDGTPGPAVTEVSLRNNEAAILIRASGQGAE
jgi:hypothetical protein